VAAGINSMFVVGNGIKTWRRYFKQGVLDSCKYKDRITNRNIQETLIERTDVPCVPPARSPPTVIQVYMPPILLA
jgi:hypothetical protein